MSGKGILKLMLLAMVFTNAWLIVTAVRLYFFDHGAMGPMPLHVEQSLWVITPSWIHPRPTMTPKERADYDRHDKAWRTEKERKARQAAADSMERLRREKRQRDLVATKTRGHSK